MIKVENLKKNFGSLEVLKDINLTVEEGEKLVIIGPSGSGKSTLIRCMNYLEEPTAGDVYINDHLLTKKNRGEMAKNYSSMVFQQFNLYPHMTVLQNLTLAPIKLQKVPKKEAEETAMKYLERVGLADKADAYPQNLSGGQQQRVAIARALASDAQVILADEPTGNLDEDTAAEITAILKDSAHKSGKCVVIVTHSNELAKEADVVFRLRKGDLQISDTSEIEQERKKK